MQPSVVRLVRIAVLCLALASAAAAEEPASPGSGAYQPITVKQRVNWFAESTVGLESLAGGLFSSALSTATNTPSEYGPHWDGYGKRYGMRLTGISTSNAMEAGLGAMWGEDPRYLRVADRPVKSRIANVIFKTFEAPRADGHYAPAYARFIAIPGNNFLSSTWRADGEADANHAALRTVYGFLGRMGSNAFKEFWPDLTHVFHK